MRERPTNVRRTRILHVASALLGASLCARALAQASDRGPGLPTSHPGVYVEKGEVLLDVSYQSVSDQDFQYLPDDFGFPSPGEFEGEHDAGTALLLAAWGISDRFAIEMRGSATDGAVPA